MLNLNNSIVINDNLNKKLWKAIFVKKISQLFFTTKLFYETPSNNNITTKHELINYTILLLKKNTLLLNKPSYLLTCQNFLSKHLFLLKKKSAGVINTNELTNLVHLIINTNYKFAPLKATNIPKNIIIIKNKADIIKLKRTLTGNKHKNLIKIINNKKFKFNKKYLISNWLIYNCTNLQDKLIQYAIKTIIEALLIIKNILPNELYSYNSKKSILNFMFDWWSVSYTARFLNKLNVSEFFQSLNKKTIIKAFSLIIAKNDVIFFTLLKKLLNCSYVLNITKTSKWIGSKKVIKKQYNQNNYKIYQGTILAPIISNLVNILILNDIKAILPKYNYGTRVQKNKVKTNLSNWIYKLKQKNNINTHKLKELIIKMRKTKSSVFSNKFAWATVFLYFDNLLWVTHLSNEQNNELIKQFINIYQKYKLKINKTKLNTVFCFNNNKGISFLGFYLWGPNTVGWSKKNAIKSNCRLGMDTVKIKNKLMLLGVLTLRSLPTGTRDWSANYKNLKQKKANLRLLTKKEIKYWNKLIYDPNYKVISLLPVATLQANNILKFFYYKMLGIVNYYKYCEYSSYLPYFIWILKMSCYKTLCAKFKVNTIKGLFWKFGDSLQKLEINNKFFIKFNTYDKNLPKLKLTTELIKSNNYSKDYELFFNNFTKIQINTQSDWIKLNCNLCNKKSNNLQLHHIKSVSNLRKSIEHLKFKYKNSKFLQSNSNELFKLIHISKNWKQIVVCSDCHYKIHNKTLDQKLLIKLAKFIK